MALSILAQGSFLARSRERLWSLCFLRSAAEASLNSLALVRERTILTSDSRLSAKVVSTFAERGCHVASVTDPYGCVLGFLG
jgi:hypothetical protein